MALGVRALLDLAGDHGREEGGEALGPGGGRRGVAVVATAVEVVGRAGQGAEGQREGVVPQLVVLAVVGVAPVRAAGGLGAHHDARRLGVLGVVARRPGPVGGAGRGDPVVGLDAERGGAADPQAIDEREAPAHALVDLHELRGGGWAVRGIEGGLAGGRRIDGGPELDRLVGGEDREAGGLPPSRRVATTMVASATAVKRKRPSSSVVVWRGVGFSSRRTSSPTRGLPSASTTLPATSQGAAGARRGSSASPRVEASTRGRIVIALPSRARSGARWARSRRPAPR